MCSKLLQPDPDASKKYFRGNYIFCHEQQIVNGRPTACDDLYSLLCVAYKFVFGTLPWLKSAEDRKKEDPFFRVYQLNQWCNFRTEHAKEFDDSLIASSEKLKPLFKYVIQTRRKYKKPNAAGLGNQKYEVDHDHMMSLLQGEKESHIPGLLKSIVKSPIYKFASFNVPRNSLQSFG